MTAYLPHPVTSHDELQAELTRAFEHLQGALAAGSPVVVLLEERNVQATEEPLAAALAHGLIGLVRAAAIEGRQAGWHVAALSYLPHTDDAELQRWVGSLAASASTSGSLVRLGGEHLGRVAV
ncbi:hypothetical protein DSM112329_04290 [Paraconexibacter sp. AEG42_29]|uniref:Uncharacterized protein n=2 Tax=Paraconexibacter sp. AEG42_29 TaxID=2997339 RepID=A0AAU7B0H2_9ACTN